VDLRGGVGGHRDAIPRAATAVADVIDNVSPIVADVAQRGAPAVEEWTQRLDGVTPPSLRVPVSHLDECLADLDPEVRRGLETAIGRVSLVHRQQRPVESQTTVSPGGVVGQRWLPVRRVGLYVPGGRAVYPSSVVMNVVPAQVAGVDSIAVVSPPQRDHGGWPHPTVLAACRLLGIDEVYSAGGAQAIALLAYGADLPDGRCAPVDLITGPGNVWVTAAKRLVMGRVGIDAEAGPTEILILADETADPRLVAADLISQAEHDPLAAAVLVTDSPELAAAVVPELDRQVAATKHGERIIESLSGQQSAIVLVGGLGDAVTLANDYGAEHLEIQTRDAQALSQAITNAGAIFIGSHSPVSLGDYAAGSNHVLPTGGASAHSSGLGVHTFLRSVQTIAYDQQALADISDAIRVLAQEEDLPAHGAAIAIRFPDGDRPEPR
jgi:histidinol dehydrogenase